MANEEAQQAVRMLKNHRWSALATTGQDGPMASMVSYAIEPDLGILMFLSGLARHSRNLKETPLASLVVAEPDQPEVADPQTIARVSVQGTVEGIPRDDPGFGPAWQVYVDRFPFAAPRLQLGDFTLYRLVPSAARWVGGFGAARTIKPDALRAAAEQIT